MSGAHIGSRDVLVAFRQRWVQFDDECQRALSAVGSDVSRVVEWLKHDQLFYWEAQLKKREEMVRMARSDYLRAAHGPKYQRKNSAVEERVLLDRAKRLAAEAGEKIAAVKRWSAGLEQQTGPLLQSCATLSTMLRSLTPRALARLDRMADSLEDYLRAAGPASRVSGGERPPPDSPPRRRLPEGPTMRLTSASDAQLVSAVNDLLRDWAVAGEEWRDQARAEFEKEYVEELSPAVRRAVGDIRELKQVLRRAIQECT